MKTIEVKDIIISKLSKKLATQEVLIAELEATIMYLNQELKASQTKVKYHEDEVIEIPDQPQPIIED